MYIQQFDTTCSRTNEDESGMRCNEAGRGDTGLCGAFCENDDLSLSVTIYILWLNKCDEFIPKKVAVLLLSLLSQ